MDSHAPRPVAPGIHARRKAGEYAFAPVPQLLLARGADKANTVINWGRAS